MLRKGFAADVTAWAYCECFFLHLNLKKPLEKHSSVIQCWRKGHAIPSSELDTMEHMK